MKGARDRTSRAAGVSAAKTLAGAALLVVVGFGIGLLVGAAVWEDPSLLAGHVAGRTEEVPLPPPVASEPPAQAEALSPPAEAESARASEASPRPSTAAAPSQTAALRAPVPAEPARREGRYAVQVGSFEEPEPAERLEERLRGHGFPVYVSRATVSGVLRWRVRVGPLAQRDEAERLEARLKNKEQLPTWLLTSEH